MDPWTENSGNPYKSYVFRKAGPVVIIRKTSVSRIIAQIVKHFTKSTVMPQVWYFQDILVIIHLSIISFPILSMIYHTYSVIR